MADGVLTHLQREVAHHQQELERLEAKIDGGLSQVRTEIEKLGTEMRNMFKQLMAKDGGSKTVSSSGGNNAGQSTQHKTTTLPLVVEAVETSGEVANRSCRHGRLECPRFDGENFNEWLMKLDQFFEAEKVQDEAKVRIVMMQLEGRALQWHQYYVQTNGILLAREWNLYIEEMRKRFGDSEFSDPMSEIVALKQTDTVKKYHEKGAGIVVTDSNIFQSIFKPFIVGYRVETVVNTCEKFEDVHSMVFVDKFVPANDTYGFRLLVMGRRCIGIEGLTTMVMGILISRTLNQASIGYQEIQIPTVRFFEVETGGLRVGGGGKFVAPTGQNRRALSTINRNVIGAPPYPCAVNKRPLSERNAVCDKVHYKFELMDETLYLTVNLVDRFLEVQQVVRKKLQLVGITAMLLACKYEEVSVPVVEDLILISDKAYSRKEVLDMEKLMINTLQFNLSLPTPYVFMRRFLKVAQSNKKLELLSFFTIELCLVEYEMLKFPPSLLAAAAILTASVKGSIKVCHLYFEIVESLGSAYYLNWAMKSIWRMDFEMIKFVIASILAIFLVAMDSNFLVEEFMLLANMTAAVSLQRKEALSIAALNHGIPSPELLADVAAYCNESKLASRHAEDACEKLYMWLLLKKKKILFSDARVLGLGPKFMSVYIQKLVSERRIYYDKVEGLPVEWFESTSTLVLNLASHKQLFKRGGLGNYMALGNVAWVVNPYDLSVETGNIDDHDATCMVNGGVTFSDLEPISKSWVDLGTHGVRGAFCLFNLWNSKSLTVIIEMGWWWPSTLPNWLLLYHIRKDNMQDLREITICCLCQTRGQSTGESTSEQEDEILTDCFYVDEEGLIVKAPACILDRWMRKQGNCAVTEVLVQWINGFPEDAIWKKLSHLQQKFPHSDP